MAAAASSTSCAHVWNSGLPLTESAHWSADSHTIMSVAVSRASSSRTHNAWRDVHAASSGVCPW